jgi:hypothetical protein
MATAMSEKAWRAGVARPGDGHVPCSAICISSHALVYDVETAANWTKVGYAWAVNPCLIQIGEGESP